VTSWVWREAVNWPRRARGSLFCLKDEQQVKRIRRRGILLLPLESELEGGNEAFKYVARALRFANLIGRPRPRSVTNGKGLPRFVEWLWFNVQLLVYGASNAEHYDTVVATSHWYALQGTLLALLYRKRLICCYGAYSWAYWRNGIRSFPYSAALRIIELISSRFADILIVATERDRRALTRGGAKHQKVLVLPPVYPSKMLSEAVSTRTQKVVRRILFVGDVSYLPNAEAAKWIDRVLCPYLRESGWAGEVVLVGRGNPALRLVNAHYLGYVRDIFREIREADLCIAPVWKCVGAVTKVLDYLACGRPSVVSWEVAETISGVEDGVHCLIARGGADFRQKVRELIESPSRRHQLGVKGQELVRERYSEEVSAETLVRALENEGK